jgi:peptidoglycan/LPS O-acetylase OafA/YrhL
MGGLLSVLSGKLEIGHMWYIESLLVLCLIYALIRHTIPHYQLSMVNCQLFKPTIIGLLIFGAVMGIGSYFIRLVSPQDHWIWPFGIIPLPMEPAHYLQYVMMFVIGILARRFAWLEKMGNTTGAISLAIGCLLALGIYLRDGGAWNAFVAEWFGIYESLLCVFICFGLLWLFRECGNWDSKFWQWCAAQSYGAYIFHLLLMIVLQYATDGIWMGAFGKFMFIGMITAICSFVLTWLVRMILGAKKVL